MIAFPARLKRKTRYILAIAARLTAQPEGVLVQTCVDRAIRAATAPDVEAKSTEAAWRHLEPLVEAYRELAKQETIRANPTTYKLPLDSAFAVREASKIESEEVKEGKAAMTPAQIMEACVEQNLIEVAAEQIVRRIAAGDMETVHALLQTIKTPRKRSSRDFVALPSNGKHAEPAMLKAYQHPDMFSRMTALSRGEVAMPGIGQLEPLPKTFAKKAAGSSKKTRKLQGKRKK